MRLFHLVENLNVSLQQLVFDLVTALQRKWYGTQSCIDIDSRHNLLLLNVGVCALPVNQWIS
jgi:hypothetical protein